MSEGTEVQLWTDYSIGLDQWAKWEIGPLILFAQARHREWIFAWRSNDDPMLNTASVEIATAQSPDPDSFEFARFAAREMPDTFSLAPRLGDRAFVVRPASAVSLLAGEETVLFINTVLWICVSIGSDSNNLAGSTLLDTPAFRPSDTWFGPNTLEGELCYASRTSARTDLAAIDPLPHRAVTPIEIVNRGKDALVIEQLRVPVTSLGLYADTGGRIWTDSVRLIRDEGEREAELEIPELSDHLPGGLTRLSEPREPPEAGSIVAAFSRFLG